MWELRSNEFLVKKLITKNQKKQIRDRNYCFKTSTDLIDTELTHFANIGWFSNNSYHPVACFTCDENIEKIKFRLGLYKSQINAVKEMLTNISQEKLPAHNFEFKNGVVCVCSNKTGAIEEIISLEELDHII